MIGAQDRLTITGMLGQGGMGRVYSAVRQSDGRAVAVKTLRTERLGIDEYEESLGRFRQEAQTASAVGHPGIIDIFGFERTPDGQVLLVMELLEGESLQDWLERPGSLREGLGLLAKLGDAMDAAHEAGIVHRDIKPANLFLARCPDGTVQPKILDFGLAKIAKSDFTQVETQAGTVLGTPYYLAPERALGKPLDRRADLYSFGVVLYEMLTGGVPFDADNFMEVVAGHVKVIPLDPRQARPDRPIPDSVAGLAMRMLSKAPADRPQRASEFAAACRALEAAEGDALALVVTGPGAVAGASASTMTLEGSPETKTAAPGAATATADAATVAPLDGPAAAGSDVLAFGPMTAFAGGRTAKSTVMVDPRALGPAGPAGRSGKGLWIGGAVGVVAAASAAAVLAMGGDPTPSEPHKAPVPTAVVDEAVPASVAAEATPSLPPKTAVTPPDKDRPDDAPSAIEEPAVPPEQPPEPPTTAPSDQPPRKRGSKKRAGKRGQKTAKPRTPAEPTSPKPATKPDPGSGLPAFKDDVYGD